MIYVQEIPIANPSSDQKNVLESKIKEVLTLKNANQLADTSDLENEIDQLVYELYGLTEEEIAIVEASLT
jgi:adenine-specific DNA-methyltransferase